MTKNRTTTKTIVRDLEDRYYSIMRKYKFDPNNGNAQVKGASEERKIAYAQFELLDQLIYEYGK